MYIQIYTYMNVYMCIYIYICMYIYIYIFICICNYDRDYVDAAVRTTLQIHQCEGKGDILIFLTGEEVRTYVHMFISTYICICVYVY
jgi:hypothetical protein